MKTLKWNIYKINDNTNPPEDNYITIIADALGRHWESSGQKPDANKNWIQELDLGTHRLGEKTEWTGYSFDSSHWRREFNLWSFSFIQNMTGMEYLGCQLGSPVLSTPSYRCDFAASQCGTQDLVEILIFVGIWARDFLYTNP